MEKDRQTSVNTWVEGNVAVGWNRLHEEVHTHKHQEGGCQGGHDSLIPIMCIVLLQDRSNSQSDCCTVKGKRGDRMVKIVYLPLVLAGVRNRMDTCKVSTAISKAFGAGHERAWLQQTHPHFGHCNTMLSTKFKLEYHGIELSTNREIQISVYTHIEVKREIGRQASGQMGRQRWISLKKS